MVGQQHAGAQDEEGNTVSWKRHAATWLMSAHTHVYVRACGIVCVRVRGRRCGLASARGARTDTLTQAHASASTHTTVAGLGTLLRDTPPCLTCSSGPQRPPAPARRTGRGCSGRRLRGRSCRLRLLGVAKHVAKQWLICEGGEGRWRGRCGDQRHWQRGVRQVDAVGAGGGRLVYACCVCGGPPGASK